MDAPGPIPLDELKRNSGLPGPRGNLELLGRSLLSCTPESVAQCLAELGPQTSNSPEEFVGMCGVVGFAVLNAADPGVLVGHLATYARHPSWRIREAVAIALQEIPVATLADRLAVTGALEDDDPLVCRAIVAGLCEPRNLKGQRGVEGVYGHLGRATALLAGKDRLTDGEESLKKALGYCWSVALASFFDEGRAAFEALAATPDKTLRWIVKENLSKARLVKRNGPWVAELQALLAAGGR